MRAEPDVIGRRMLGMPWRNISPKTGRYSVACVGRKAVELTNAHALRHGVIYHIHFTPTTELLY